MPTLAFGPKADLLITGGTDAVTRLWKIDTMQPLHAVKGHEKTLYAAAFAPSGKLAATACADGRIVLWEVERGTQVRVIQAGGRLNGLAFSRDGELLYGGGWSGVQIWVVASGQRQSDLEGFDGPVNGMCTDAGGRLLAASGAGGLRVWDLEDHRLLHTLPVSGSDVYPVALHPDRRLAAAGGEDGSVRVWDLDSRELVQTVAAHRGRVHGLCFDPAGTVLATAGEDTFIRLWRVRAPRPTGR